MQATTPKLTIQIHRDVVSLYYRDQIAKLTAKIDHPPAATDTGAWYAHWQKMIDLRNALRREEIDLCKAWKLEDAVRDARHKDYNLQEWRTEVTLSGQTKNGA